jgi:hypothetical protein
MRSPLTPKYGFRIRTRVGLVLDKLTIPGRDMEDAQRKLRQIYRDCEILECVCQRDDVAEQTAGFEDVVSLITR